MSKKNVNIHQKETQENWEQDHRLKTTKPSGWFKQTLFQPDWRTTNIQQLNQKKGSPNRLTAFLPAGKGYALIKHFLGGFWGFFYGCLLLETKVNSDCCDKFSLQHAPFCKKKSKKGKKKWKEKIVAPK